MAAQGRHGLRSASSFRFTSSYFPKVTTISRRSWFPFYLQPFPGGHGFRSTSNHFQEVMVSVLPPTISRRSQGPAPTLLFVSGSRPPPLMVMRRAGFAEIGLEHEAIAGGVLL